MTATANDQVVKIDRILGTVMQHDMLQGQTRDAAMGYYAERGYRLAKVVVDERNFEVEYLHFTLEVSA